MRYLAALFAALSAAVGVACGPGTSTAAGDRDVNDIRRARAALTEPVERVGTLAMSLTRDVTAVRLGEPPDPAERLAAVDAVRAGVLNDLATASAQLADTNLVGSGGAIVDARAALAEVAAAADAVAAAARADLEFVATLASADAELVQLVAVWDQPGSRREQLTRLAEAADAAGELAIRLRATDERPPCGAAVARRADAAATAAAASTELRGLVAARRGTAFDRRRAELAADPAGAGIAHLAALDVADRPCVEREAATVVATDHLRATIDRLVTVLNDPPT